MSLLTVSLLIDSLIPLVNSPALVKNEKKPFVLVQTRRIRMDVQAAGGRGGAGSAFSLVRRLCFLATPTRAWGGKGGMRRTRVPGASILSLSVCACSSLCLRWGHVSARSYVVLCKLSPGVCLPIVKGPGPRQRKGLRMCKLVVRGSVHMSLIVSRQVF